MSRPYRELERVSLELGSDPQWLQSLRALPRPLGSLLLASLVHRRCQDIPTPFQQLNALLAPSLPLSPEQLATSVMRFADDTISLSSKPPYTEDSLLFRNPTGSITWYCLLAKRWRSITPTSDGMIPETSSP